MAGKLPLMMPTLLIAIGLARPAGELAIANEHLRRELAPDGRGAVTTTRLADAKGGITLESREFCIRFADGREIRPAQLPQVELHALPSALGPRGALARFSAPDQPFAVEVAWLAAAGAPWLKKQVRLVNADPAASALPVASIDLETLTVAGATWRGGGIGRAARASNGLFVAPDHPGVECRIDAATVTLREHCTAGRELDRWSAAVTIGLDRAGDLAAQLAASFAPDASDPSVSLRPRAEAALMLSDADLRADRSIDAAALIAAARSASDAGARVTLVAPAAWLGSGRWYQPTVPIGALGRALQELGQPPTAVALTVPLHAPDGTPLPLANAEELRSARKALVALLQCAGRLEAPRWFLHPAPTAWPADPAAAAQLVEGWIALFATERKLAPAARLALLLPPEGDAPAWRRHVDHVAVLVDATFATAWPAAPTRAALAAALAGRGGDGAPLVAFARGDDDANRWAAAALSFWNLAPVGADAPQVRRNDRWTTQTDELPPHAGGWLRIAPWLEYVGGDATTAAPVVLGAHETAVFAPLIASDARGAIPDAGRFEFGGDGTLSALLLPGATQSFRWRDARDGRVLRAAQIGLAPAFQRRTAEVPFAVKLAQLARDDDTLRFTLEFAAPIFRAEEVELRLECDGVTASEASALRFDCDAMPARAIERPDETSARWRLSLAEGRTSPTLHGVLAGRLPADARVTIVAALHEQLDPVALKPPTASRAPRRLPATPFAARRTTTLVLHDGPLPPAARAASVEPASPGQ